MLIYNNLLHFFFSKPFTRTNAFTSKITSGRYFITDTLKSPPAVILNSFGVNYVRIAIICY